MSEIIMSELKSGSKTAGALKDACGYDYPALFTEPSKLIADSLIEHFMDGDSPALHYRAAGTVEVSSRWQMMLPKR